MSSHAYDPVTSFLGVWGGIVVKALCY